MSRVLTGEKLVDSVRNRAMIPDDNSVYTDDNILAIANEELDVQLLDKLLSLHEEHLTVHVDIPKNDSGTYDIPYRAIGNKVRDIALIQGNQVYEMSQISIGALSDYDLRNTSSYSETDKFYIESDNIKLINPSTSYDSVRIYYYIRPSFITKTDKAGAIASITTLGDEVTLVLSNIPSTFNTNLTYDIVGVRTPNKIKIYDINPIEVNTNLKSVKFNLSDIEDVLDGLRVGDYLCKAEESPVPNIPTEMHPVLAQLTAVHVLEALGDTEGLANAERRLDKMVKSTMQLVDARVELAPKKIKPRHGTLAEARSIGLRKKRR